MFKCEVCGKEFENTNLLQRHFSFKNGEEPNHREFKNKQIKIAEELFLTDKSGDTYHILKNHPEINLICERKLRDIWREEYGTEAIEKRRTEISFKKNNEIRYEPMRQKRNEGKDKKCPVCDYKYKGNRTLSHHISMLKDEVHLKFFNEQKEIARNLFEEKLAAERLLKTHSEFVLSEQVLIRFWKEIFGKEKITERKIEISSNSRLGILPWNNGLTKENHLGLQKMSNTRKKQFQDGVYDNFINPIKVSEKLKEGYKNGTRIPPTLNPETNKKISATLLNGHASGRIKLTHGQGGFIKEFGHYVRSTWEYNFAKILHRLKISYEYEPKVFPLYNEKGKLIDTYTPDFRLKNRWYEIKGIFKSAKDWSGVPKNWQGNITKINLFKKQYPEEKLVIIGKKEYKKIIKKFNLPYRYPKGFMKEQSQC